MPFLVLLRAPNRYIDACGNSHIRIRLEPMKMMRLGGALSVLAHGAMEAGVSTMCRSGFWEGSLPRSIRCTGKVFRLLRAREMSDEVVADRGDETIALARDAKARSLVRRDEVKDIIQRLETIGRPLSGDGAAWKAVRGVYERVVAAVVTVRGTTVPAAGSAVQANITRLDTVTRDTLLGVKGISAIRFRCDALTAGRKDNRYAEHVVHSMNSFIDITGHKALRNYLPADIQEYSSVPSRVHSDLREKKVFDDAEDPPRVAGKLMGDGWKILASASARSLFFTRCGVMRKHGSDQRRPIGLPI